MATHFASIFANGWMKVFSGVRPADPTKPATGTEIGRITHNGDAFTPGVVTNGLVWGTPVESDDGLWVILPFGGASNPQIFCTLAAGQSATVSWLRLYPNAADDGLEDTDNTRPRVDILAGTLLDASLGGLNSATGSLKIYGQTKSSLNVRRIMIPLYSGQEYTG